MLLMLLRRIRRNPNNKTHPPQQLLLTPSPKSAKRTPNVLRFSSCINLIINYLTK